MSYNVYDREGLTITQYAGPVRADKGDRRRYEVVVTNKRGDRTSTSLSWEQMTDLQLRLIEGPRKAREES